ncbi:TMPRSS9 [Mytilus edulis]|uniref:TMPRSS9 n=1 Tax=Mytilus edulis TaxID=6550 RepID=A0A8S3R5S8_MYTED|nr:TMPRSS9 [Mytilus edulis]
MPDKTTQIVAGNNGTIEDFPFIAEIQQRAKHQKAWRHWCGAVIISETMLITSAACLRGPNVKDDNGVQFDNNIGVIELHTPLKFGPRCQSISYTTIKGSDGFKNCQISGWGYIDANKTETDTLQFADISVLSNAKCNDLVDPIIPKSQICTFDFDNKKQPCNGDAGGPLTCEINGSRFLVGVFAWLFNDCDAKNPSFYSHTTQIVAGNDAAIEDFPFIAVVQGRAKRHDPWKHYCSAVIISETMLVTSAACIRGPYVI